MVGVPASVVGVSHAILASELSGHERLRWDDHETRMKERKRRDRQTLHVKSLSFTGGNVHSMPVLADKVETLLCTQLFPVGYATGCEHIQRR